MRFRHEWKHEIFYVEMLASQPVVCRYAAGQSRGKWQV